MPTALTAIAIILTAINLLTIFSFDVDKRAALHGERRTPESTLLWLAALGGTPAAYWARRRYRHKTRKQPFSLRLHLIAMVQAGIALGLASLMF